VQLIVGSWNVESGEADANVVGQRLAAFEGVDLWDAISLRGATDFGLFELRFLDVKQVHFATGSC
jgi:hypothetical protein